MDLACGTGLNFSYLPPLITSEEKIIGVDFTGAIIDIARNKTKSAGWSNIELIQSNLSEYEYPDKIAGIVATFAISLVPNFDEVIQRGATALRSDGRMAILDIKSPQYWPKWMARLTAWINHPFGVTLETTYRRPWETLRKHLKEVCYQEYFFDYLYLSVGQKSNQDELTNGVEESGI